jgi:hypothetical protein
MFEIIFAVFYAAKHDRKPLFFAILTLIFLIVFLVCGFRNVGEVYDYESGMNYKAGSLFSPNEYENVYFRTPAVQLNADIKDATHKMIPPVVTFAILTLIAGLLTFKMVTDYIRRDEAGEFDEKLEKANPAPGTDTYSSVAAALLVQNNAGPDASEDASEGNEPVKYCWRCGTELPAESVFCSSCGGKQ